jgi:ATP-dependent Clp protease ATP-binding subunit ClpB
VDGTGQDVEDANGKIVLFIDELHTLVGVGKADGAIDAANMLKPALAQGLLRCMGATTLEEYRRHGCGLILLAAPYCRNARMIAYRYIESDAALARRFQPVYVAEPSLEDTVTILRGLKAKYEVHHGVRITDSALLAAARLSLRYVPQRKFPDKALDLVDETSAWLKMQQESKPDVVDEMDRQVLRRKMEIEALKHETDDGAKERIVRSDGISASGMLNRVFRQAKGRGVHHAARTRRAHAQMGHGEEKTSRVE